MGPSGRAVDGAASGAPGKPTRPGKTLPDWLSLRPGYDAFISYRRDDASEYASSLERNLADRGFACFLDSKDAPAGLPLKEHIRAALKRSSVLIVVGTAGAVGSPYVEEEIREFLSGRKRPIIPIDVDGHFANCAATDGPWHVLRRERDHIWLDVDAAEFESGRPRAKTLEGITRQFRHTKNNTKRRRLLMGVGALLLILTTAAVWLAITAILARDRAEANGREARLQANRAQAALRESEQNRQRAERESSRAETQRQVAEQRQAEAQHQAELALARLLVVLSEQKRTLDDPVPSAILAAEAFSRFPSEESETAAREAIRSLPRILATTRVLPAAGSGIFDRVQP
ncbi:MAG TPA: TIR domain-containing protein [Verrucomicrobiae bacterium]|nr:TIR domain-containing protein [Verrucomicrobiae bacterium]